MLLLALVPTSSRSSSSLFSSAECDAALSWSSDSGSGVGNEARLRLFGRAVAVELAVRLAGVVAALEERELGRADDLRVFVMAATTVLSFVARAAVLRGGGGAPSRGV